MLTTLFCCRQAPEDQERGTGRWERKQIPAALLEWGQQPSKAVCRGHGGLGKGPPPLRAQLEPHAGLCCCGRRLDSPWGLPSR